MNELAGTSEAAQAASFLVPDTPGAEVMSSQAAMQLACHVVAA